MPTKRRFIIFLIVLTLMLLIKRAVGQEPTVGWDPTCAGGFDARMPDEVQSILLNSACAGVLLGIAKVWARASAERRGTYFPGHLIQLRLQ